MTHPSKRKIKIKEQERDNYGRFAKKLRVADNWGDDDDSGWDDEVDMLNEKDKYELVWSDNTHLERKKRGPYLAGKTKKSTYFDKYGPSGCFTKAAKGTAKITIFINKHRSTPDDFEEVLDDMEDEEQAKLDLNERIEILKIELKKQQNSLSVTEYNKKRAIFEYLRRLSDNDGKGKTIRLIDDEDIAEEYHIWIRSQGGTTTPLKFKDHERPDVVKYQELFLDKIYDYVKFMAKYEGENMEQIPPTLGPNDKEIILVTHDECVFYSNDGKQGVWAKSGELPLRKKGNDRSIMVSEFLSEECGRLKLNAQQIQENPSIPKEARAYLQPGKDREGFWTSEHLIDQVKTKTIPIFETLFPNCIALFAFDNSSNHAAFKSDALVASRMNLKPGGKQPKMRNTIFGPSNQHQSMVNENGEPKGIKQVLIERGLWKNGLNADCQLCKDKVDDENRVDCCARWIISLQPDFLGQKSASEEVILEAGHKCIFYPKFHCELNYIERYWGAAKRYTRENCNYSWSGLQHTVPAALESVNTITIRKFARKAWRYMDLYRKGVTGKLAEYAAKKYKSHRCIPDYVLAELNK
ncbi:hypothetical protein RCL_jg21131.t1 [Rhizophagus clarus]|uniref:Uncharacterized protein n=1 Tax=Rhizophagus clarus TaxID=94130 RepID=A0A8H3LUW8_9GLOM|nr:hypothetical protein RCL_jg21131.t1 [Rhizophagus clarus]